MGQSPEELKQEIESTRSDLGQTLDAIGDRVSPGRVLERRTNRVRQQVRGLRERVMGAAQDTVDVGKDRLGSSVEAVRDVPDAVGQRAQGNPLVAGALAFGIGFLVASLAPRTEAESKVAATVTDEVEPLKDEIVEAGRDAVQNLSEPTRRGSPAREGRGYGRSPRRHRPGTRKCQ